MQYEIITFAANYITKIITSFFFDYRIHIHALTLTVFF